MQNQYERREHLRAPMDTYINEKVSDITLLALAVDICERGIRYIKPRGQFRRLCRVVFLEFYLPKEEMPIRVRGQVVYDNLSVNSHATVVIFSELSAEETRRIQQYVIRRKQSELLDLLRKNHLGVSSALVTTGSSKCLTATILLPEHYPDGKEVECQTYTEARRKGNTPCKKTPALFEY